MENAVEVVITNIPHRIVYLRRWPNTCPGPRGGTIKSTYSTLLILALLIFESCDDTNVTNTYIGGIPGKLVGKVILLDTLRDSRNQFIALTDHSGVRIGVEGKPYFTTSDSSGYWELNDLPPGNHTVTFTNDGFVPYIYVGYPFVGNGVDYMSTRVLQRRSHLGVSVTLRPFEDYIDDSRYKDTIIVDSLGERVRISTRDIIYEPKGKAVFTAKLLNDPGVGTYEASGLMVFARSQNFSLTDPTSYQFISPWPSPYDEATGKQDFAIMRSQLLKAGFKSGEKIYCTAYAATGYQYYMNIPSLKYIFIGFEGCSSEVKSFILP